MQAGERRFAATVSVMPGLRNGAISKNGLFNMQQWERRGNLFFPPPDIQGRRTSDSARRPSPFPLATTGNSPPRTSHERRFVTVLRLARRAGVRLIHRMDFNAQSAAYLKRIEDGIDRLEIIYRFLESKGLLPDG